MKPELQLILDKINSAEVSRYNDYINQVKFLIEKLNQLRQEDKNPMLDAWLSMGLEEIRKELSNRLNNDFSKLSLEKQKQEFMYSRSTVAMALTNIIMHM